MKKFMHAGASVVALMAALAAVPANAADIYRRDAAPSMKEPALMGPAAWQGLYLGGHAGYAWGNVDADHACGPVNNEHWGMAPFCTPGGKFDTHGFIGGGQAGYNFQRGNIVFGPEIGLGYLGLKGGKDDYAGKGGFYGDFTGRLGYSLGSTLLYAKGGAAVADAKFTAGAEPVNGTLWGWTVGGGIERKLRPNLSIKVEYQHFEFEDATLTSGSNTFKFSPTVDAVTAGINVHLNRDASPLK